MRMLAKAQHASPRAQSGIEPAASGRYNPAPFAGNLFSFQRLNSLGIDDRTRTSDNIVRACCASVARHALAVWHCACAAGACRRRAWRAPTKSRCDCASPGAAAPSGSGRASVGLSAGTFSELTPLGIEADEPGSIWLDGAQIRIRQRSPRAYDGIDVLVTAELDARLSIWLSDEQSETAKTVEIALRDLVGATHDTVLDDVGNRLFVSRSPGDRLRVEFDREHLVFRAGRDVLVPGPALV